MMECGPGIAHRPPPLRAGAAVGQALLRVGPRARARAALLLLRPFGGTAQIRVCRGLGRHAWVCGGVEGWRTRGPAAAGGGGVGGGGDREEAGSPPQHMSQAEGAIQGLSLRRGGGSLRNANMNEPSRGRHLPHGWRLVVGGGWWLAVGGGWQLAVGGGWQLAVGGWWWLVVGGWRLVVIGGGWRLMAVGSWRLAVSAGCPEWLP